MIAFNQAEISGIELEAEDSIKEGDFSPVVTSLFLVDCLNTWIPSVRFLFQASLLLHLWGLVVISSSIHSVCWDHTLL